MQKCTDDETRHGQYGTKCDGGGLSYGGHESEEMYENEMSK